MNQIRPEGERTPQLCRRITHPSRNIPRRSRGPQTARPTHQLVYLEDMDQKAAASGYGRDTRGQCSRVPAGRLPAEAAASCPACRRRRRSEPDVAPEPAASPDQRRSALRRMRKTTETADDQEKTRRARGRKREERPLMAFNIK